MGILDTAGNLIDQGVAGAKKGTKSISLKTQIGDVVKKREATCAQLGAAVYDQMRDNPEFRAPHDAFFTSIEGFDVQIETLKSELASLENPPQEAPVMSDAAPASAQPDAAPAPQADAPVMSDAAPAPAPDAGAPEAVAAGKFCTSCGQQSPQESMFCGGCGAKL